MNYDPADIQKNKGVAIVARIIPILFFLPLVSCPESLFAKFHANKGLLQLLLGIACSVVSIIPILGWIVAMVGGIMSFVFWIMGIISVCNGEAKPLPLIGSIEILK